MPDLLNWAAPYAREFPVVVVGLAVAWYAARRERANAAEASRRADAQHQRHVDDLKEVHRRECDRLDAQIADLKRERAELQRKLSRRRRQP